MNKTLSDATKQEIMADLGLTADEIESMIAEASKNRASMEGVKTALKEEVTAPAPTEETPAEAPVATPATEVPVAEKSEPNADVVALQAKIEELSSLIVGLKSESISRSQLAEILNSVPKGEITRPSQTGTEVPAEDVNKELEKRKKEADERAQLASGMTPGFQEIYKQFGSKQS